MSSATAKKLIHGYYACVSFTDAQIGRIMQSLDHLGLAANTVVLLWGDHGWQLGEHGMWNKHSCFETSMHAPLIVTWPLIQSIRLAHALDRWSSSLISTRRSASWQD